MDKFVKELTTKLADYPEPVVLVMYEIGRAHV